MSNSLKNTERAYSLLSIFATSKLIYEGYYIYNIDVIRPSLLLGETTSSKLDYTNI